MTLPNCPECNCDYPYQDRDLIICPQCGHEWSEGDQPDDDESIKDANGNPLQDGDSVTVIKDLKVKGSSSIIKVGTKVKNIRLIGGADHNIDCKIDGIGALKLTAHFVKKI